MVTSILLLGFLLIQLFFQGFIYHYLRKIGTSASGLSGQDDLPPVSVVVAAHNEEDNLIDHIPLLLEQEYPEFELVLVNDRSTDGTLAVMHAYAARHPNIRIVDIQGPVRHDGTFGKKNALSMGIKAAANDFLVFTDADCRPADSQWLKRLGGRFGTGHTFVIGTGFFEPQPSFLNALYRLESARTAMLYFSGAAAGIPYMAVGRSMGYAKELFFEVRGYLNHMRVPSGDDDLFLQSVAGRARIALVPDALTISKAPSSATGWYRQRLRHLTAGKRYKFAPLALLASYEISLFGTIAGLAVFWYIAEPDWLWQVFYGGVFLRYLLFFLNLHRFESLAGFRGYAAKLFWTDWILSIWNALISVAYQLSKSARWRKNT